MRYLYLHLFSIHLMYNNAATSILLFSCKHSLIAFMWNILAQKVFQVINLSSPFVSVFTILNVRKLLTPNSLDAVTVTLGKNGASQTAAMEALQSVPLLDREPELGVSPGVRDGVCSPAVYGREAGVVT